MALNTVKRSRGDYAIGWICAIEPELNAARAALDEVHPKLPAVQGDTNNYLFGRIGDHNIVIASLPSGTYGTNAAAIAATEMRRSFRDLRFGLMVGIGGGVPKITNNLAITKDIRLGDVVVSNPEGTSPGVIQYDLGKSEEGKRWPLRTGTLNKPPRILRNAVAAIRSRYRFEPKSHSNQMIAITEKHPFLVPEYAYQGAENDVLFKARSSHKEANETCEECNLAELVSRSSRPNFDAVIHYGSIASGNQLVKDSVARDYWGDKESVLCFEMEAAGLMDDFQCLVIRGICDYADSHKNKRWQPYAAMAAAAYAKDLLLEIAPEEVRDTQKTFLGTWEQELQKSESYRTFTTTNRLLSTLPTYSNPSFVGRDFILTDIESKFCNSTSSHQRVALLGLSGIGKSQIALRYAQKSLGSRHVFWLPAGSRDMLGAGIRDLLAKLLPGKEIPYSGQEQSMILNKILQNEEFGRWLIVLDGADDRDLFTKDNKDVHQAIIKWLPFVPHGRVLVTSTDNRIRGLADGLVVPSINGIHVETLALPDAVQLIKSLLAPEQIYKSDENSYTRLVTLLGCFPLALVQCAAYLRETHIDTSEYCKLFLSQDQGLNVFSDFPAFSWDLEQKSVMTTWEMSYRIIGGENQPKTPTAMLLDRIGFLHFESITEYFLKGLYEVRLQQKTGFASAIGTLQNFALLKPDGKLGFSMHPLVHRWLSHRLIQFPEDRKSCVEDIGYILGLLYPNNPGSKAYKQISRSLALHAGNFLRLENVTLTAETTDEKTYLRFTDLQLNFARFLGLEDIPYQLVGIRILEKSIFNQKERSEVELFPRRLLLGKLYYKVAESYLEKAKEQFQRCLETARGDIVKEEFVRTLLAIVMIRLGEGDQAVRERKLLLRMRRKSYEDDSFPVVQAKNALAATLRYNAFCLWPTGLYYGSGAEEHVSKMITERVQRLNSAFSRLENESELTDSCIGVFETAGKTDHEIYLDCLSRKLENFCKVDINRVSRSCMASVDAHMSIEGLSMVLNSYTSQIRLAKPGSSWLLSQKLICSALKFIEIPKPPDLEELDWYLVYGNFKQLLGSNLFWLGRMAEGRPNWEAAWLVMTDLRHLHDGFKQETLDEIAWSLAVTLIAQQDSDAFKARWPMYRKHVRAMASLPQPEVLKDSYSARFYESLLRVEADLQQLVNLEENGGELVEWAIVEQEPSPDAIDQEDIDIELRPIPIRYRLSFS